MKNSLSDLVVIIIISLVASCSSGPSQNQISDQPESVSQTTNPDGSAQVEVYYLHGRSRCPSCIAIEEAAIETVDRFFSEQIKAGSLRFSILNIELPENQQLARKYQAMGPTLLISTMNGDEEIVKDMTSEGFRFAMRDKTRFISMLRHSVEETLEKN